MDRSTSEPPRRGRVPVLSVRLRLLVLALAPLTVLMPLLLVLGMTRWTSDYDELLIANVESDLRIAEQYLARILETTGDELTGVAESAEFGRVLQVSGPTFDSYLAEKREALNADIAKADISDF